VKKIKVMGQTNKMEAVREGMQESDREEEMEKCRRVEWMGGGSGLLYSVRATH
jgi:hypothetical protein